MTDYRYVDCMEKQAIYYKTKGEAELADDHYRIAYYLQRSICEFAQDPKTEAENNIRAAYLASMCNKENFVKYHLHKAKSLLDEGVVVSKERMQDYEKLCKEMSDIAHNRSLIAHSMLLTALDLHSKAMECADEAIYSLSTHQPEEVTKNLFAKAFELEKQAALMDLPEPTKSILVKSAANLADNAGLYDQRDKMLSLLNTPKQ